MYNFNDYNNQYMYKQPHLQQQYNIPKVQQDISQTNVNWIPVSGIDDAKNRIAQPNCTLWMMDNNAYRFYVKTADNFGVTNFKVFEFREILENEQTNNNYTNYVTKEEIEQIIEQKINDLAEKELRKRG